MEIHWFGAANLEAQRLKAPNSSNVYLPSQSEKLDATPKKDRTET
jgi:hypothetical protein